MAAIAGDSLFNVSQSFFSPDILQKISKEINQPVEQTRVGLKSAIPTLLMGIINKGSTKEGAETLVDIANHQAPIADVATDPTEIREGNEVVNKIFGNNLNGILAKLGTTTGMNVASLNKMLGMTAPLVMGAISSKIKTEHMTPSALMSFLSQQKSSLSSMLPSGLPGLSALSSSQALPKIVDRGNVWPKIVLGILVLVGLFWWYSSRQTVSEETRTTSMPAMPAIASRENIQPINTLGNFMNSASAGTVKRFKFENLTFKTGTISVGAGANKELDHIVAVMKNHPKATARIEGYTDNVGLPANNIALSSKRAMAVKDELVFRGVRSSRIETVGRGESDPIASNKTTEGRTANRRIEFVIQL
ncbi:hypothetical protein DOM21_19045 [Bacteriovorax stolpii]|uniref:OmpA family protein n=1 Tax=Bacteriovorax stolpii TaxID=960 RepID=UPI00115B7B55|nr:OmpA family protein [Bacteriovorax stolpii]QDK43514.1 hypothetical protein DOM21_19045 [Bacteriovorax stolpii]